MGEEVETYILKLSKPRKRESGVETGDCKDSSGGREKEPILSAVSISVTEMANIAPSSSTVVGYNAEKKIGGELSNQQR